MLPKTGLPGRRFCPSQWHYGSSFSELGAYSWTFFVISYGWYVICGNLSKSAVFQREVGRFECKFQTEGVSPTNRCWCQKTILPLVPNCLQCIVWFCHKARVWQTDRQTELRCIAQRLQILPGNLPVCLQTKFSCSNLQPRPVLFAHC